jgi:exopolysaccharide biosynthesis polyprenyl glycosylphosphotransferase
MLASRKATFLIIIDFFSAFVSWALFFVFRKIYIEKVPLEINDTFYYGILIIPACWIGLYFLQGTYADVKRMFRMKILSLTFFGTLIGSTSIFFIFLLDDTVQTYAHYYQSFLALFAIQFLVSFIPRIVFTSVQVKKIHTGKEGFNALLLGGSEKAVGIYKEIQNLHKSIGTQFIGFVNLNGIDTLLKDELSYLGHVDDLEKIIEQYKVEEVIIALESTEHQRLSSIITRLSGTGIKIKVLPDVFDILAGSIKMTNIFGVLLLEVNPDGMPIWQQSIKRFIDISLSLIALILLIPVYIFLAIAVKTSSKGPIFFRQERIGLNGRKFKIIKFRTMYMDAEAKGPQLSSTFDPRITKSGRFMRKARLDEFPQFFNVLIGDMSLVGPRPERQFYIDQIVAREPQFLQLTTVRPGITSWGQVKYGYAENVDQMLQRMKFDLLYLKNMSLALDLKIMLYTILIILKAKGK